MEISDNISETVSSTIVSVLDSIEANDDARAVNVDEEEEDGSMILDKTSKERAISDDNHDFVQEDGSIIVDSDSEEGASNQPDAILDDMDDDDIDQQLEAQALEAEQEYQTIQEELKAKAKNEHFNEAIKKLNVAKTAKSNAIERARAKLAIKRAAFENAQLSVIRAKNRVYVGKGDKKDITTLYECSVAESKARADIETATKLFMDQESQANITYMNNKRKIWAAFTNQMEILYDY